MSASDFARVLRAAEEQGFRHRKTERGHHQFYAPNGKDIVTVGRLENSGNDPRSWKNFMADMKRVGFAEATTSLGDVLREAQEKTEEREVEVPEKKEKKRSVRAVLEEILSSVDRSMTRNEIATLVRSKRLDTTDQAVSGALYTLQLKRLIRQTDRGVWIKTTAVPKSLPLSKPVAGEKTGDPAIDADLEKLDSALAALAEVESVVKRNRDWLFELARLKQTLGVK